MKRKIAHLGLSLVGPIVLIVMLTIPIGPLAGGLGIIQPLGGIFDGGIGLDNKADQTIVLDGIDDEVEVIIDRYGIPHIYAQSARDAHMALGYMHAKERLFQMVMQNSLAAGRISEIVGSYASSSDKFYRAIGLARSAQITYEWYLNHNDDPDVAYALELVNAEVDGVNAFIRSMTSATTPIEFKLLGVTPELWQPLDIFIWAKMMTWGLSGGIRDFTREYMRATLQNDSMLNELYFDAQPYSVPIIPEQTNLSLGEYPNAPGGFSIGSLSSQVLDSSKLALAGIEPETAKKITDVFENVIQPFGPEDFVGSNNWVIDGSKSSTGFPILANDPHLGLQAPSLWYEAHIVVPGLLDVSGVSFPGLPGFVLGHTDHIAWGFTNVGADVLDIVVEKTNPENSSQYEYNNEWKDFTIYDETIHTKEGRDIPFEVKWSVHGPCIDAVVETHDSDSNTEPNLAMMWTGNQITHELLSLSILNKATGIEDYHKSMYWWDSPPQNIVYADDAGHTAITVAGRFPIRSGYTGEFPVQLLNDSVGWTGYIPFAYNPRSVDPAQHYLQSANQQSISFDDYGYQLLGPFASGYRGRRIDELLKNDESVTMEDMMRFQADSLDISAREIVPIVLDDWSSLGSSNESLQDLVDELGDWDFVMKTNSSAPTIWLYLQSALNYEVFDEVWTAGSDIMMPFIPVLEKMLKENKVYYIDDHRTQSIVETRDDIVLRALHRTLNYLVLDLGENRTNWQYGEQHIIVLEHLAALTYIGGGPHRGSGFTLNAAHGHRSSGWDERFVVTSGPSWRMVANLGDIENSYGVYPGGQSGVPFSEHWADLFELWYSFDESLGHYGYHKMYYYSSPTDFRDNDINDNLIERTITFIP
jgi:penicillin amidase